MEVKCTFQALLEAAIALSRVFPPASARLAGSASACCGPFGVAIETSSKYESAQGSEVWSPHGGMQSSPRDTAGLVHVDGPLPGLEMIQSFDHAGGRPGLSCLSSLKCSSFR